MKLKSVVLTMSLLSMFMTSCFGGKKEPIRPLVSLHYRYGSQMHMIPSVYFDVKKDSTGIIATTYNQKSNRYECIQINDDQLMQKFTDVILKYKMYNYKGSYNNPHVLDGDSWGFSAKFHDETSTWETHDQDYISSGGSNAWPKDDGLSEISRLFKEAQEQATFLYVCDEEGDRMPSHLEQEVATGAGDNEFMYVSLNPHAHRLDLNLRNWKESQLFKERFPGVELDETYYYIKTLAPKVYGARLLDDGHQYLLCLIVNDGAVEFLPFADVLKASRNQVFTTQVSVQDDMRDVLLRDGKIYGITDEEGQEVELEWKPIVHDEQ